MLLSLGSGDASAGVSKLSDALVIATADTDGADRLITTDREWPTAKAMKLTAAIGQI